MDDIINRLKAYLAAKKLSGTALGKEVGRSPVTVNQYLSGRRQSVPCDFIADVLAHYPDLSAEWLTRGVGDMIIVPNSNESVQKITRELADAKVKMIVQEGVIDKLLKVIGGKIGDNQYIEAKTLKSDVG